MKIQGSKNIRKAWNAAAGLGAHDNDENINTRLLSCVCLLHPL